MLKYKTRHSLDPKNKPKVYFTCHPKEFDKYFESISNEILDKQDCTFWYLENPTEYRDESFYEDLKQMQLLVMPVSTLLLCSENPALNQDFNFAKEHHIPILALLQEPDLNFLFNQKCGNLQYLKKNNLDITSIPYEKKLENFLSSVLLGDEELKKIQSSFSSYIFLSYRKKDRKYVHELMEQIHKNSLFRDVAIWYDEFLIPGENFNDSIGNALKKSDLFLLMVTPNLVNENNYIITTEYPMAMKEKKTVLPVEVVPTDKEALKKCFKNIPVCIDFSEETFFSDAISNVLKNVLNLNNDKSPEHIYYIGLAYLGGIDVEVNYALALDLITYAAEHEVIAAAKKLRDMYINGIGVEVSYQKGIEWSEKLISFLKKIFDNNPNEDSYYELLYALMEAGNLYRITGDVLLEKEKWLYFLELTKDDDDLEWLCKLRLGDIYALNLEYTQALTFYNELVERKKESMETSTDGSIHCDLACCYQKMGDVYASQNNTDDAINYYFKALDIKEKYSYDVLDYKLEKGLLYASIGHTFLNAWKCSFAKKFFLLSSKLFIEMNDILNSFYCYCFLGEACYGDNNYIEARKYLKKALEISSNHYDNNDYIKRIDIQKIKANAYKVLGWIEYEEKNYSESINFFKNALDILSIESYDIECLKAVLYRSIGHVYIDLKGYDYAYDYLAKAAELLEKQYKEKEYMAAFLNLANVYNDLAFIYEKKANLKEAKRYYRKSIILCQNLRKETSDVLVADRLASTYYRYSLILHKDEKLTYLYLALINYKKLADNNPDNPNYKRKVDELNRLCIDEQRKYL